MLIPLLMYVGPAPTDIAASLVSALFLIRSCASNNWSWLRERWVQIAMLFWTFLIVHSLFQSDVLHSLSRAAPWGRYPLLAAAIAFWLGRESSFSKRMLFSIALACSVMACDAWVQYLSGTSMTGNPKWYGGRLTGPYDMPRLGYTIVWIIIPLIAFCAKFDKEKKLLSFCKVIFALFWLSAILITGDRTPLFLLILSFLAVCALSPYVRQRIIFCGPILLLLFTALYFQPSLYYRYVNETKDHLGRFWHNPYGEIVLDSWDLIQQSPVLGVGVKEYRNVSKGLREPQPHPHNFYLELIVETGVFGFLLLLTMHAVWLGDMWQTYSLWKMNLLVIGLVAAIGVRIWPFSVSPSYYTSWNVIPFWLILGWWYSYKNILCEQYQINLRVSNAES